MNNSRKFDWAEAFRWTLLVAIMLVGCWLGILVVGEEAPELAENRDAMSLFWQLKFSALLALVGLYFIGHKCHVAGLLPKWWDEQMKEEA